MAVCTWCQGEMTLHVTCIETPQAIRYMDPIEIDSFRKGSGPDKQLTESIIRSMKKKGYCGDCGTPVGGFHHPGCDMEACPGCHMQRISCGCGFDK
jgi:hypothetical protein